MISTHSTFFFCDVCDTLYRSNTTFDFIRFVVAKRSKLQHFLLKLISSTRSPLFYMLILLNKATHRDWPRQLALRFLRGMTAEELDKEALEFYHQFLVPRANAEVFHYILQPGVTAILLSSSIHPVIKAIAKANQLSYFSSELGMEQGKATGKLLVDMTGCKHEMANKLIAERALSSFGVITDNRTDWQLVQLADERLVVVANESQKQFWKSLNPHFILIR